MKRALFVTHALPQGYRIQQYFPFLGERGFEVELVTTKLGFFSLLEQIRSADITYIQRLLFSPLKLSLIRRCAKQLVYDFDDAVMYGAKGESSTRQRKFKAMVLAADAVFAGNRFLFAEAGRYRNEGIHYVPTVVDTSAYSVKVHGTTAPLVVGWIGSASTLPYLSEVMEPLKAMAEEGKIMIKIVADKAPEQRGRGIIFEKWQKDGEQASLLSFDIGMMPVKDDLWSRGKCGLKMIQYMAAGLPSVTHPVGAAREIVVDGINGFLRDDAAGWQEVIETLSVDRDLRQRVGRAARDSAEERYSLAVWGPKVADLIEDLSNAPLPGTR